MSGSPFYSSLLTSSVILSNIMSLNKIKILKIPTVILQVLYVFNMRWTLNIFVGNTSRCQLNYKTLNAKFWFN